MKDVEQKLRMLLITIRICNTRKLRSRGKLTSLRRYDPQKTYVINYIYIHVVIFLSLVRNSGRLKWVRHSGRKSSVTRFKWGCAVFLTVCPNAAACFGGFVTCTQMLMHAAIAYGGCTDTVRESALEVDSGTRIIYCAWLCFSVGRSTLPTELSRSLPKIMPTLFFRGALRPQKPYGLLGTGRQTLVCMDVYI